MRIKHVKNDNYLDENYSAPYLHIRKPYTSNCCYLNSSEMLINFCSTHRALGRIKQPFTCCDPEFYIYDDSEAERFIIKADCCQCGLFCANNFCGKLSEVYFNIYNFRDRVASCGQIIKKGASTREFVTSADSYEIIFPNDASPKDKLLLIIAGLFID